MTTDMNTDERLDRILQIEHEIARLQAEQLRHIATVADDPCEGAVAPRVEKSYIREEIRALIGESASGVLNRIETARMVVHRLPVALAALEAGELTLRHVHALVSATAELDDADVAEIEAECVPFAKGRDYTAFSRKVHRSVVALTSITPTEHLERLLMDRRVCSFPSADGAMATISALLRADGAATVMGAVNAEADRSKQPDDARTLDQRRADALVQIAADALDRFSGVIRNDKHSKSRRGPAVQVTVAASTLLGVDDQPGELAGHGPIPAALARAIAADPTGTWRRLVTDAQGVLIDYGRTKYKPPTPLKEFVNARDRECQFTGCHRRAAYCEQDHLIPWSDGGTTCADNLICLCPRHHHAKHEAGWTVQRLTDGRLEWTSPHGRVFCKDRPAYDVVVFDDKNAAARHRRAQLTSAVASSIET